VRNIGGNSSCGSRNPPTKAISAPVAHRQTRKKYLREKFHPFDKIFFPPTTDCGFLIALTQHPVVVGGGSLGIRLLLAGYWVPPEELFTSHSQNRDPP
jgi:hypothetical protein